MTTRSPRIGTPRSIAWVAAVAIVSALTLTSCGAGGTSADGVQLAQYDGKGFTVSYPASWKPYPHGKVVTDAKFEVVKLSKADNSPYASMHIRVHDDAGVLTDTVSTFAANIKISNNKLLERKEVEVKGTDEGYIIRQAYPLEHETFRIRQVDLLTLTEAGKTLDVRLVCRANLCKRYEETFDAVLDSVRITDSQ